ncbi:MAG: type II toxin-antitoxin system Xre/ParS family antitoxin [Pseudomonadota bacterium]
MLDTRRIVDMLGGPGVLGREIERTSEAIELVRDGLPTRVLDVIMARLDLSRDEVSAVAGIPLRTLARRQREERLKPEESNRIYRLAQVTAFAEDVFGDLDKAHHWLRKPNRALGGQVPLDLLDTDLGTAEVRNVLGRIAHGVHS